MTDENLEQGNSEIETSNEVESKSIIDMITDEELKGSKSLSNFKDINGLAKSYIHLEKKLGAPKEPEKYEADKYTYDLPENYKANGNILDEVKSKAVELGLKPEAFKTLVETFTNKEMAFMLDESKKQEEEFNNQLNAEKEFIKGKTGQEADKLIETSKGTWQKFVDPRYKDLFDNFDKGTQIVLADLMNSIASKVSEPNTGKQSLGSSISKAEALEKIEAIRKSTELSFEQQQKELAKYYNVAYS